MKDPREISALDRQVHEHEVEHHEEYRLLISENGAHKVYYDTDKPSEFTPHDHDLTVEYKRQINPERLHMIEEVAYDHLKAKGKLADHPKTLLIGLEQAKKGMTKSLPFSIDEDDLTPRGDLDWDLD